MASEVRSIMGPSFPRVSYSSTSRSFVSSPSAASSSMTLIPRKPKRKSKSSIALEKYMGLPKKKGKSAKAGGPSFQKKLVVFNFMGPNAPANFTRKDKNIVMRGLLPEIPFDADEEHIREEICDVIKSCKEYDLSLCSERDFEFIDMSGKLASVPNCKQGYKFTGKAVKNLAGSGCVYVRLTLDLVSFFLSSDSSDNDLPKVSVKNVNNDTPIEIDLSDEDMNTQAIDSNSQSPYHDSHLRQSSISGPSLASTSCSPGPSLASTSCSPGLSLTSTSCSPGSSSASTSTSNSSWPSGLQVFKLQPGDVSNLTEIFPHVSEENVKFVFAESGEDVDGTTNCLIEGPTSVSISSLLRKSRITTSLSDSPKIRLDSDDDVDDMVSAAITYYKGQEFDRLAQVRIYMRNGPSVDTGGVRCDFFTAVFERLATEKYRLFEGPSHRLRPVFRMSNVSSGMMRCLGLMVAHSFILDRNGFPYLSECCYYYLAGLVDKAITVVSESI